MKKGLSVFLKVFLILIVVLILAAGGFAFYVYRMVNNYEIYQDKYVDYEDELAKFEATKFDDYVFYDKDNYLFSYEVPRACIYKVINKESMEEYLNLPEDMKITEIGVEPDLDAKKVTIYMGIRYKNLVHCAMKVDGDLSVSEDRKRLELRSNDYYLINDKAMEYADKYISIPKGDLMFTHYFPTFVIYYQMPDYKVEHVHDLKYDGKFITATYDIKAAIAQYKEEEYDKNTLQQKLEAVWLEVRQAGIKHN